MKDPYILGDWGTSNLRLFLMESGHIIDQQRGPGVAATKPGEHGALLEGAIAKWRDRAGACPIYLVGTVGANIGLIEVPYMTAKASAQELAAAAALISIGDHACRVTPGLSGPNFQGAADVMRGEETQIIGLIEGCPALAEGVRLVCLPGTHTKWVLLQDGHVERFQSSMIGELFDLLRNQSLLCRGVPADTPFDWSAFDRGAKAARELEWGGTLQALFSVRSKQLTGHLAPAEAPAYLSGLLVGDDVRCAVEALPTSVRTGFSATIAGNALMAECYARQMVESGLSVTVEDEQTAVLAGLHKIYDLGSFHG